MADYHPSNSAVRSLTKGMYDVSHPHTGSFLIGLPESGLRRALICCRQPHHTDPLPLSYITRRDHVQFFVETQGRQTQAQAPPTQVVAAVVTPRRCRKCNRCTPVSGHGSDSRRSRVPCFHAYVLRKRIAQSISPTNNSHTHATNADDRSHTKSLSRLQRQLSAIDVRVIREAQSRHGLLLVHGKDFSLLHVMS